MEKKTIKSKFFEFLREYPAFKIFGSIGGIVVTIALLLFSNITNRLIDKQLDTIFNPGSEAPTPMPESISESYTNNKAYQGAVTVGYHSNGSDFIKVTAGGGNGDGPYMFAISETNNWSNAIGGWYYQDNLETTFGEKTFSDLKPDTTYYVFSYKGASSSHYESDVSRPLNISTS